MIHRPPRLRPGDTVALIAPAGPVPSQRLPAAVLTLESWGLTVRVSAGAYETSPELSYLAGDDTRRAADFAEAWVDPSVAAVIAARGGYGCQRMIDLVDWRALTQVAPKVFVGSSDTTALHQAIAARLGLATLLAPMPATSHFDAAAADHLRATLLRPEDARVLDSPASSPIVPGRVCGTLVGGNLSMVTSWLGTSDDTRPAGAIAALEDVGEEPYRIDRMLTQLLRSGWFDGVTGVALGSWARCDRASDLRAVFRDRLATLGVPVASSLNFGHHPGALTVPLGVHAELDADAGILVLDTPALR